MANMAENYRNGAYPQMRLLVVDDEKYTREGILEELNFKDLGIDEVLEARNGQLAYQIMLNEDVDILLTDVKMPKMNGIDLAYKVQSLNPGCPIIFMSGYSDKEYLKSAIELNAVSYIEKPLDMLELSSALRKSVTLINNRSTQQQRMKDQAHLLENSIALELTRNKSNQHYQNELLSQMDEDFLNFPAFQTYLLISHKEPITDVFPQKNLESLQEILDKPVLYGYKDANHLILHIAWDYMETQHQMVIYHDIKTRLDRLTDGTYTMCVGPMVDNIGLIPHSYQESVLASKQYFLHPGKPILIGSNSEPIPTSEIFDHRKCHQFKAYLEKKDITGAIDYINRLTLSLKQWQQLIPEQVISFYYQFLLSFIDVISTEGLGAKVPASVNFSDTAAFFLSENVDEAHYFIVELLKHYGDSIDQNTYDNPIINQIIDYIHTHYHNSDLSLSDIAEDVAVSLSHMCVLFKKETEMTINHYLTQYRLNQSLGLLKDHDMKLAYVASKVGFNDGNYYAKLFKKTLGITPTEYRDA